MIRKIERITSAVIKLLIVIQTVSACSVKEDRSECMCRLVLDLCGVEADGFPMDIQLTAADGFLKSERLLERQGSFVISVPRGKMHLHACSGMGEFGTLIPQGEECPHLRMYDKELVTLNDVCNDTVHLHKQFCLISVKVILDSSEPYPFDICISGNYNGYLDDSSVSSGHFEVTAHPSSSGECTVSVPRQKDDALLMQMMDSCSVLRVFPVGLYMKDAGYDWEAADLEDVEISIDYANSSVTMVSPGWEGNHIYDIIF